MRLKKHHVLILAIFTVISLLSSFVSAWSSDYDSWQYRKAIMINGSATGLTEYQVPVNLTTAIYNNTGLVGSWHFTANSTEDSSGKDNLGMQYGGVNCTAIGKVGGGCEFDGVNDEITITANTLDSWTIAAWIKHRGTWAGSENIVSSSGGAEFGPLMAWNGRIGMDDIGVYAPTALDNNWHFVATNIGEGYSRVYIDGTEAANVAASPSTAPSSIGGPPYFNGTIDEVRIYNRSLSAQEIKDMYNAGKSRLDYQDLRFTQNYSIYETPINISGANLTDYQVLINITNTTIISHMRPDGGDMRFFNYTTETPYLNETLPFWVENISANQVLIWLKTNVTVTGSMIYMYYGNVSATYDNSLGGNNTFEFFDDFNDNSLKTGWVILSSGVDGSVSETGGELAVTSCSTGWCYESAMWSGNTWKASDGLRIKVKRRADYSGERINSLIFSPDNTTGNLDSITDKVFDYQSTTYGYRLFNKSSGTDTQLWTEAITPGTTSHNAELDITNTTALYKYDDIVKYNGAYTIDWGTNNSYMRLGDWASADSFTTYFDDVSVSKYASLEPSAALGSETVKSQNNEAPLSHWLESDSLAWVKVPNIAANANTNLYMYYGKHSASTASDYFSIMQVLGDGSDGALTVSSADTIVNNYTYMSWNQSAGNATIAVNSGTAFSNGDEILIIQMQNYSGGIAGQYEFRKISSGGGTTSFTLGAPLNGNYTSGTFDSTTASVTQVVRVPQYTNVTVNSVASITAPAWNGYEGGIVVFRANGTVNVTGAINVTNKGFRGGNGAVWTCWFSCDDWGWQGESYTGKGTQLNGNNLGAGGGGRSNGGRAGGGGGGYATAGSSGTIQPGYFGPEGTGGGAYGSSGLSTIFLGSGGGGGSNGAPTAFGGNGSGIVMIFSSSINGLITARGGDWVSGGEGQAGGAGGSILVVSANISSLTTNASYGLGQPVACCGESGGDGGYGRIRLMANSISGTSTPSAYTAGFDITHNSQYASPEPSVLSFSAEETHPVYWLKTYSLSGNAKSFFAINESIIIKAKADNISGKITVTGPDGIVLVNNANMTNETALSGGMLVWNYSFNLSAKAGWYGVEIFGNAQQAAFFVGETWQDNWTDSEGEIFPFRMEMNVSEPNIIERFFEPVETNVTFTYKANASSIRVAQWNGTNLIDVPSQSYNLTYSGNYATTGNVVFLATTGKSQNLTYYIYYSRSNQALAYGTDLRATNDSINYEIQNSNYRATFSISTIWEKLLKEAYNKKGDNRNMGAYNPLQRAPEAKSGPSLYEASDPSTASNSLESGALRAKYNVSGYHGTMNFSLTYTAYAKTPYILLETNTSSSASETWDYYLDQQFYLKDGYFTSTTWKNTTGVYESPMGAGNGNDQPNLGNLNWIALYNNISGNSFGTIYLETSQSRAYTPNNGFNNDAAYERYTRTQYYQGDVSPGDYFYSKTAIVIWNALDGYEKLNETYYQLKNPLSTSIGASETYDTEAPINTSSGFYPTSPKDNESITCYSYWTDNLELDYAIVKINSSGHNNQSTVQINANESWVNYTISAAALEAGTVTCNVTVYDVTTLANSTQTSIVVSDNTTPYFASVTNLPNTYIGLDPLVQINITANLTEYTGIDTVILQYRNDSGEWANSSMNKTWNSTYNYSYSANFTPEINGTWQYRIYAKDTLGNSNYSEITNLSIAYESAWQSSPANLGEVSGLYRSNISAGNLIINNTADLPFSFWIESNWDNKDQIFFNGTSEGGGFVLNLDSGGSAILPVIVTAKSVEKSDELNITIIALNGSATPSSNTTTATIISYPSGPFLLVSITNYNISVTQGDTGILLKAKVQNKGNETATNAWLAFELPSGWSVTSGNLNKSIGTLSVNSISYQNITVSVSDSATTGTQAITALSGSSEKNETQTSVTVIVLAKPATTTVIQTVTSGGGGGGSATTATGLTTEQKEKLFQTEETYELVRGEAQNFTLKMENPFDGTLENVSVRISGFLSQYLRMYPQRVDKIPAGKSFNFSVVIEAPTYFKRGTHILNFTITGHVSKQKSSSNTSRTEITHMKESRLVTLIIYEVSEKDASRYLNESADLLNELNRIGLANEDLNSLVIQANESFENKDYENLKQIYEAIKEKKESAFATLALLDEVTQKRDKAAYDGIQTTETSKLISFSKSALERGDYETALERAEDAKMTFAVETAGKFNIIKFTENNWQGLSTGTVTLAILLYLGIMSMQYHLISRKCRYLKNEEKILIGMVKQIQKECFEDGKLSIEEYIEGLLQYEKKISEILQEKIRLETVQTNLFKFLKKEKDLLLEEKNKLLRVISETQSTYIKEGSIETKIYENRVKSCVGRVAEIEEMLANIEAKNAMKGGKYISW